jgi:hypothetical protein
MWANSQETGPVMPRIGLLSRERSESGTLTVPDSGQPWHAPVFSGQDCTATSSGLLRLAQARLISKPKKEIVRLGIGVLIFPY